MIRDIRFGLRVLWRDRGYAATAIITLAICLGANTAIFTIVNSVLLRPLAVPGSNRILLMSNQYPKAGTGGNSTNSAVPDYYDRLRDVNAFEEQAVYNSAYRVIQIDGSPELVRGMTATPSLFRLLKVAPIQGRVFDESEGETANETRIILSYGLWQQLYGGKPVVGQQLRMGRLFTIVGVMPKSFEFVDPEARFWIPLAFTPKQKSDDERHSNGLHNIGRLKPGATLQQAQQQVDALNAANLERFPQFKQLLINAGFHTRVERLQDSLVVPFKERLYLLWGGAIFVLLIGAVNIANLSLARSNLRLRELSTRLALGAVRSRLARQLIVESSLLALTGGIGAIFVGSLILRALATIGLDRIPRAGEIHMDATAVGAALSVSLIAGFMIGLVPIAHLFKMDLNALLREDSRTGTGARKTQALRRVLVTAQIAFACVLLVGSGLLLASFRNLLAVDPGFQPDGVMTFSVGIYGSAHKTDDDVHAFTNHLLDGIRSVAGVAAVGATTTVPLSGNVSENVIIAEGHEIKPGESMVAPATIVVTPGYFEAMHTPLKRGRYFNDHDTGTSPAVVIIDERLAQKFWPGADPIGKRMYVPQTPDDLVKTDEKTRWLTVAGVVHEVRLEDLAPRSDSPGAYYLAAAQEVRRDLIIVIRTSADPAAVLRSVRSEVQKLDPGMLLTNIRTMAEYTDLSLISRKAEMLLSLAFAMVSLFLSAVGIYGVLAYLVTQRSREIGIRVALGSTARGIFALILREGLWLVGGGLLVGLAGTLALRRVLQSRIYGLGAFDPFVIGIVLLTLGTVALAACSLPARRATKVDPIVVLNQQ